MDALIRNAGADRVGEDASVKLSQVLEESGRKIAEKAMVCARHAGRSQIQKEDILLAMKL
ncbi:histone [Candidatus Micrarchaeota archaeon CG_4_10_14_0_2_um_filter_60_11]|nr:MAG: hypothetical protein AUJ16_03155 [Candidatus Micrarchaeota archaeon CG1_02_60_51]PIN96438.1 MAG: histone [Candidatus Micrarchaeota archaeon CG10_big_fil_rev_8_21_14_0_10_60_32]PIO02375.1 MAG: histone [Candidatus Micrarchaeota archaeon CG09_land_8_20_14_0_10_60_16]PIY91943.1 MAG: histone [Candidatus Micrarchaeota archaeon CG_4_10_14_0_8_um_filter_60_7]PIZ90725.1 MAG: histone [Candidatus Micrarchaeota archaeon CG_4_10_14_0_2_um_filter_60_11]